MLIPSTEGIILFVVFFNCGRIGTQSAHILKNCREGLDEPLLSANPANSIVKNNITYISNSELFGAMKNIASLNHGIGEDVPKFSEVVDNPIFINDRSDFPGWHNGNYILRENSLAKQQCPDFEPIPFDQIGRIK